MMDDTFVFPLPMHLPQKPETTAAATTTTETANDDLLDSNLIAGDAPRMMPMVRVLVTMLLNEFICWTVTLFATLVFPLFIAANGAAAVFFLVLMVVALVVLSICYGVMIECRRAKYPPPLTYFMVVLHGSMLALCVCSALLIHALATLCFVLMVWTGTLAMLLRLVQSPYTLSAMQLSSLAAFSSILVCFVCVAQELTLQDALVNGMAFALNALFIAFRHDWLSSHATASNTTYNMSNTDRAWLDLYTWTVDSRIVEPCRPKHGNSTATTPIYVPVNTYQDEEL